VLQTPLIRIDAQGVGAKFRAVPVTGVKAVKSLIEKFREKYGAKDVKKYYSTFDVAVVVELVQSTVFGSQIELQIERRMRFRFPEDEPRQQTDTHQHTANSRYKCQRVRRPYACHEPPAEHRCEVSQ
jgi:hypothetical protein